MPTISSFLCISHATADRTVTEKFCGILGSFGFSTVCLDETTPTDERDECLHACAMLLVLTSPEASRLTSCETDFHYMMSLHRPVMCIRLYPSELEHRLTQGDGAISERFISFPYIETDHPDDRTLALFFHRLFIRHLCRLPACFNHDTCTDPQRGKLVRRAVKAWQGDRYAQYLMGLAYDRGELLPRMDTEAALWMTRSAQSGYVEAMLYLGDMKLTGDGGDKNPTEALHLFNVASGSHDPRGYYARGLCCLYGYGIMKDPEMALHHMKSAADESYIPAYYRLGLMYRDGIGIPYRHWRRAVACLYAACRAEGLGEPLYGRCVHHHRDERHYHCVSMRHMRQLRLGDRLFAAKNPHWREDTHLAAKAKRAFTKNVVTAVGYPENGDLDGLDTSRDAARYDPTRTYSRQPWDVAVAAEALGRLLELGSPAEHIPPAPRAAMAWYRRAIRRGHSGALYRLGELYRAGRGVPADPAQAVKLFRRCADYHNEKGRFALGVCYERGIGVPRDLPTAVTQYEKAARAGYAPAQNNLGGCYEHGLGVTRDMLAAVEWYSKAASAGQPNAICRLGACYENGYGVTRNTERAFRLFERAAEQGHAYAMYRLALCYDKGIYVEERPAVAARLYERAAQGGVAEAAYAYGLCCRHGRGVRCDEHAAFLCFRQAAAQGHILGAYEMGLYYLEGRAAVQSFEHAMQAFELTASLYKNGAVHAHAMQAEDAPEVQNRAAAGDALYRLGYGVLYGQGKQAEHPVQEAAAYFRRAAALGHRDAMTALGDLYTYRASETDVTEEEARCAYESAARLGQCEALLSLSEAHRKHAAAQSAAGNTQAAEAAYTAAWQALTPCIEAGDTNALQAMAAYTFFGWGCSKDPAKAYGLLRRAETMAHRTADAPADSQTAYLWLGDIYYTGQHGGVDLVAADTAYRYAASVRADAPCPIHMLHERWDDRMAQARRVQAEAYYRLAILRAVGFEDDRRADREEAFTYLAAAILCGHEGAVDDLARMYTYEKACAEEAKAALHTAAHIHSRKATAPAAMPLPGGSNDRHDHLAWMTAYYVARRPTLRPFTFTPEGRPQADAPAYITVAVTPTMRGCAMNHLGDCLFEGRELGVDPAAAVRCYRQAADTRQPRGETVAGGLVWAKYSLGWCLLNGKGTAKNPREGVRYLADAARYHADAAYLLGLCCKRGIGVDGANIREAVKYLRKSAAMHHYAAAVELKALEKQLR